MDKTDFVRAEECEGYPGIAADYEKMRQINRELVEALESMLHHIDNIHPPRKIFWSGSVAQEEARAALAKAKGEM